MTSSGVSTEFATFMRSYQDMVFTTAVRLTANEAEALDIAQEVFLRAYQDFGQLRASPTAGGWLKTVARNLSLNHLSRYRRRWRLFSELSSGDDAEEAPEPEVGVPDPHLAALASVDRQRAIENALARLPPHQRVPLVLFHFEELSYDEIAAQLRISLAKVKTDIRRARQALLPLLEASGVAADDAEQDPIETIERNRGVSPS